MAAASSEEPVEWTETVKDAIHLLCRPKGGIRNPPKLQTGIKQTSELGRKRVTYFRGRDYAFTMEELRSKHPVYLNVFSKFLDRGPDSESGKGDKLKEIDAQTAQTIIEIMLQTRIISAARYEPLGSNSSGSKAKKWPDRVVRTGAMRFSKDDYYIVNWEKPNPWDRVYAVAIVIGIVLLVLFPVWPLWIKIGIWYSLVALLVGLFVFVWGRILLFLIVWIAGFEFWILPNLFEDTVPWWEAHKPFVSLVKTEDDETFLALRSLFLLLFWSLGMEMSRQNIGLEDLTWPVEEVIDWGVNKLSPPESAGRLRLPKLDELEQEEAAETTASATGTEDESGTTRSTAGAAAAHDPSSAEGRKSEMRRAAAKTTSGTDAWGEGAEEETVVEDVFDEESGGL